MTGWPTDVLRAFTAAASRRSGRPTVELFIELTEKYDVTTIDGTVTAVQSGLEAGAALSTPDGPVAITENPTEARLADLVDTFAWAAGTCGTGRRPRAAGGPGHEQCLPTASGWPDDSTAQAARDGLAAATAAEQSGEKLTDITVRVRLRRRSWCIVRTDGTAVSGSRSGAALTARCTAGWGLTGTGSTASVSWPAGSWAPAQAGRDAARQIQHRRVSGEARPGSTVVVLAAGAGGVFLHEICGHGLEADCLGQGSVLAGLHQQQVAPAEVTIVDSGRLSGGWGSFPVDDEGRPAQETVLIGKGKLVGALSSRRTAVWTGGTSSGNARRQSYRHPSLPRTSNTYMLPGVWPAAEIVADTADGLYVRSLGAGRLSAATGQFAFSVAEGFAIRGGQLTEPVSDLVVTGNCVRALADIDRVGDDLEFRAATCRKGGQHIPVGFGQPTLRVGGLTVMPRR